MLYQTMCCNVFPARDSVSEEQLDIPHFLYNFLYSLLYITEPVILNAVIPNSFSGKGSLCHKYEVQCSQMQK